LALASVRTRVAEDSAEPAKKPVIRTTTPVVPARPPIKPAPRAPVPAPVAAPVPPPPPAVAPRGVPTADDLKVEFAEEDPEKHVVRPVSTKGNVDIQDALSKLRMSVASPGKGGGGGKAAPEGDLDRRLKDVIVAVADDAKQEVRRKVLIDVPAALLRNSSSLNLHVTFERDGREEALPEPIVIKLTGNKRLERLAVRLDFDLKIKG
jgi:hypothetical protein